MAVSRKFVLAGSVLGILGIVLGAFGAHGLKSVLTTAQLTAFETGVKYQIYHALFLLVLGTLSGLSQKAAKAIFYLTVTGIILFSGSIYLLSTQEVTGLRMSPIGFVTPVGGILLIVAWLLLFIDFLREKS